MDKDKLFFDPIYIVPSFSNIMFILKDNLQINKVAVCCEDSQVPLSFCETAQWTAPLVSLNTCHQG